MLIGALAVMSFAGVFVLALVVDSGQSLAALYAVPIALVAIEFGTGAGLTSAALGAVLMAVEVRLPGLDVGTLAVVAWAAGFFVLGWLLGRYANRLRHAFDIEQALRRSEARYRLLAENSTDMILLADLAGTTTYASPACRLILGLDPGQMIGRNGYEFVHPEDRADMLRAFGAIADVRQPVRSTCRFVRADGSEVWMEVAARSLREEDTGKAYGVEAACRDVTERRRMEERLRASEVSLATAQAVARIGSWEWDIAANQVHWSDELYRIFGVEADNTPASYDRYLARVHEDDRELVDQTVTKALTDLQPFDLKHRTARLPDGDVRVVHGLGRVLTDPDGRPVKMVGTAQDVTEQVHAEQALEEVHAQLERDAWELGRSNAELEQFAYDVSHDLGEPLRIMSQSAGCLSSRFGDRLDDEGRGLLVTIVDGLDRTQILISDLLRYSLVAREPIEPGAVDCEVVLREALDVLAGSIAEKDATVEWDELPIVTGHRPQLAQVFQNLICNALKFAREGERPTVQIRSCYEAGAWQFSVEDNGIGIAPAQGERVFEMFRRLNARDAFAGTGIGLSICRRAVERHGGRIWIAASPSGGSIVNFTIPDPPTFNGEKGDYHEPGSSQPAIGEPGSTVEARHAVS